MKSRTRLFLIIGVMLIVMPLMAASCFRGLFVDEEEERRQEEAYEKQYEEAAEKQQALENDFEEEFKVPSDDDAKDTDGNAEATPTKSPEDKIASFFDNYFNDLNIGDLEHLRLYYSVNLRYQSESQAFGLYEDTLRFDYSHDFDDYYNQTLSVDFGFANNPDQKVESHKILSIKKVPDSQEHFDKKFDERLTVVTIECTLTDGSVITRDYLYDTEEAVICGEIAYCP